MTDTGRREPENLLRCLEPGKAAPTASPAALGQDDGNSRHRVRLQARRSTADDESTEWFTGVFLGGSVGAIGIAVLLSPQEGLERILTGLLGLVFGGGGVYVAAACLFSFINSRAKSERLRQPVAFICPDAVGAGGAFHFRYCQQALVAMTADLTVSLVLREDITVAAAHAGYRPHYRDHLVDHFREEGLRLNPGAPLEREYQFRLPRHRLGFPVTGISFRWMLKVQLRSRRGFTVLENWSPVADSGFWAEYEVPTAPEGRRLGGPAEPVAVAVRRLRVRNSVRGREVAARPVEAREFDVVLTGLRPTSRRALNVLGDLMPHLSLEELDLLRRTPPSVVLEKVRRAEAEAARALLEGAGAGVEVRRGGELVIKPDYVHLPIPGNAGDPDAAALPVPAGEPEEVSRSDDGRIA